MTILFFLIDRNTSMLYCFSMTLTKKQITEIYMQIADLQDEVWAAKYADFDQIKVNEFNCKQKELIRQIKELKK